MITGSPTFISSWQSPTHTHTDVLVYVWDGVWVWACSICWMQWGFMPCVYFEKMDQNVRTASNYFLPDIFIYYFSCQRILYITCVLVIVHCVAYHVWTSNYISCLAWALGESHRSGWMKWMHDCRNIYPLYSIVHIVQLEQRTFFSTVPYTQVWNPHMTITLNSRLDLHDKKIKKQFKVSTYSQAIQQCHDE